MNLSDSSSIEPFSMLARIAARLFYNDYLGYRAVILDALTRRQWVREEDLARDLKLSLSNVRPILKYFEQERLVRHEYREEIEKGVRQHATTFASCLADALRHGTKRGEKRRLFVTTGDLARAKSVGEHARAIASSAEVMRHGTERGEKLFMTTGFRWRERIAGQRATADASSADAQCHGTEAGEERNLLTCSYYCLDYAQIHDVMRYKLHVLKKKLKDSFDRNSTNEQYSCSNCTKRFTALDETRLVAILSNDGERFLCDFCQSELVAEKAHTRRLITDVLLRMEVQFKPLVEQLDRVKDLTPPEFGTLHDWEVRASAAACSASGDNSRDQCRLYQGGTTLCFPVDPKELQSKLEDLKLQDT